MNKVQHLVFCDGVTNGAAAALSMCLLIFCVQGRVDTEECVCAWDAERGCVSYVWYRTREGGRERKSEAVWEEAAMLAPRRDWEGEGSLLTE